MSFNSAFYRVRMDLPSFDFTKTYVITDNKAFGDEASPI